MNLNKARELAAQCWCFSTTSHLEMYPALAEVVSAAILNAYLEGWKNAVKFVNSGDAQ